jgi:hypothetical protein
MTREVIARPPPSGQAGTMTTTHTPTDVLHRYLAAWNATDPAGRRAAIAAAFTPDARYVDPLADVTGHDALAALVAGAQERFPGWTFTPAGEPEGHHDVVRFAWALGPGGGDPPVLGSDVAALAPDGRISLVHGFLDRVPANRR